MKNGILVKAQLQLEMGYANRTVATSHKFNDDPYIYTKSKYKEFKDPCILNVKKTRLIKGWSRYYVSQITGIGMRRLENIENYKQGYKMKPYELEKLAKAYKCEKEDLLG